MDIERKWNKEKEEIPTWFNFPFSFEPFWELLADGLFFSRFFLAAHASLKKDFSKTSFKSERSKKRRKFHLSQQSFSSFFSLLSVVFCVCVNEKMFLLNLRFLCFARVEKEENSLEKHRHQRYVSGRGLKGKSNITRVNFSAFLFYLKGIK